MRAMLVLGGSPAYGPNLDAAAYAAQNRDERGFFVSLHELTSGYPTLTRRVVDLLSLAHGQPAPRAPRHPLAYLFASGMPSGNLGGGGSSLLIMVVIIGLLAAMAIPAFQQVRMSSQAQACLNHQRMLTAALDQYQLENGKTTETWDQLVGPEGFVTTMPVCPIHGTYTAELTDNGHIVTCDAHAALTPDH